MSLRIVPKEERIHSRSPDSKRRVDSSVASASARPDLLPKHVAMSQQPSEPFKNSDLESPEYRERLMRKLNTLIAVLEVASAKVDRSIDGPGADIDRLGKIRTNLTSTLEVCRRARKALERREDLPEGLPENLAEVVRAAGKNRIEPKRLPIGSGAEMSSSEERRRFERMGRIGREEIESVDFDDLASKFQG